ncbi:MAG: hypothetical protein CME59_18135 [Halioglobus sp.]|nr:hypothetical protein [Halioglobus sp.]|tara:strand:- start:378 stop:1079 length:702 start_codon:yes stop_codon:yes gene_type:complete
MSNPTSEQTAEFNRSYIGARPELLDLVPRSAVSILDIGCSVGELGRSVIDRNPDARVHGIEIDPDMAAVARQRLHSVLVADLEDVSLPEQFSPARFDCIIMADVLEHLRDPWAVLDQAVEVAADGATIIACLPNVRHYSTIYSLVFRGRWPYRKRGIHDRTHLRFFARKNILELFAHRSLQIQDIRTKYRITERPGGINRVARFLALPLLRGFLAYQYIVVARKTGHGKGAGV